MKRKKLPSIVKLKAKADTNLQNYYRATCSDKRCEICKGQYEVLHHFIFKSQSNYLRYELKNLIFVCRKCHYKFHNNYAQSAVAKIIKQRGQGWSDWIEAHKRLLKNDNRAELESIIKRYSLA